MSETCLSYIVMISQHCNNDSFIACYEQYKHIILKMYAF